MAIEPNLRQEIIQKLKLSPQLFKAIHILELTLPELKELLEQEFQENPLIEVEDKQKESLPEDLLEEENWSDYFEGEKDPNLEELEKKRTYRESLITKSPSLQEELLHQLRLNNVTEEEYSIGEMIIGNIDDDGYLSISLEEIAKDLNKEIKEVERILYIIQTLYPPGIGARDLRECLLLQLKRRNETDSIAFKIVDNFFSELKFKKYDKIIKELNITTEELKKAVQYISKLDPKPGKLISSEKPMYVLPELVLEETEEGKFIVKLNHEHIPSIRINQYYLKLLKDSHTPEEAKKYIQEKLSAGEWLIKAIAQRQETILKTAQYIVDVQEEFFKKGKGNLKPLTLTQVAEKLGIDESTVSRTINGKYLETPFGIFELKDFFTKAVKGEKQISIEVLKTKISELIKSEDPHHPLSDQEIVEKLKIEGINVARRTVTKYREELNILPSHLRKQKF